MIYFAKLFDITVKQINNAILSGVVLSVFGDAFRYFSSTHMISSVSNNIFIYTTLTIGYLLIVCLIYFIIAGGRNLRKTYHFDINGMWPRKIKELKKLNK